MHFANIRSEHLNIPDWTIKRGECWAVLGRNGSGKRQLGQLVAGTLEDWHGEVDNPHHRVSLMSFEAQQAFYERELKLDDTDFMDRLDAGTTVRELLDLHDIPAELAFLGLERILDRGYRLLSSGESRKALLARALLDEPDLLVLDEPYDSLDLESTRELSEFFRSLAQSGRMQLLFLLNSATEISDWHTHVAVMEKGEIIAAGPRAKIMDDAEIHALLSFDADSLPPWPEPLSAAPLPQPLVELRDGRVSYGDTVIFEHIDLRIDAGDHTLLTGANGSGKSTLLSLITGDHPQCYGNDLKVMGFQRGSGESIWEVKKRIGLVSPALHRDHRVPGSALHIVLAGFFDSIGLYDDPSDLQVRHARHWLALVGLEQKSSTPFKQLSYGEQRLALIARALVKQPALLILDEPTQGLDDVNRHRVMFFLEHLSGQKRSTIVMASHRLDERLPLFTQHLHL